VQDGHDRVIGSGILWEAVQQHDRCTTRRPLIAHREREAAPGEVVHGAF